MTDDQIKSLRDDITYMKALADEGSRGPLLGGAILVAARISPDEDWAAYTGALEAAVAGWAAETPHHPDRERVQQRAALLLDYWRSAGREALGFGLYLFRRP